VANKYFFKDEGPPADLQPLPIKY